MLKTAAAAFLLAAILAIAGAGAGMGTGVATAQTALSAPAGITAAAGPNAGEVILSWHAADGASQYRVGWINMNDFRRTQQTGEPWLERFAFTNIRASLTSYTIGRLTPGEEYAFIVASVSATGALIWPQQWTYLTTAAGPATPVCPTETPTPTPTPSPTPSPTPTPSAQAPLTNEELVRRIKPALAQIVATNSAGETGRGTGFVVRSNGLLVTNRHVVDDAAIVTVNMQNLDGQLFEYTGRVLGRGIVADLAVVQLPTGRAYPTLPLGDSDAVAGGAEVIAMGYPGGSISGTYPTVTRGIISSKGTFEDVKGLQTDAAINPGSSGGPLVNRYGQVIGVNTAKAVGNNIDNIGFAIASNEVSSRLDTLVAGGPNTATYRAHAYGYGYRVDIPRGWYLASETERCTQFRSYNATFTGMLLCASTFAETTTRNADLDTLVHSVWDSWLTAAETWDWPLIQLVSSQRLGPPGQEYYRLAWRGQSHVSRCVGDEVSLVALSSSYTESLNGFELNIGVCEGQPGQYFTERQAILDSFVP